MVPAVCFTASDNDATELLITFNNFNCPRSTHKFLENKMCPLCHAQMLHTHQEAQNQAGERLCCALGLCEALTPACAEAQSGQRAFQITMNSSSVTPQHPAIKLLLTTRAHKKYEEKTKNVMTFGIKTRGVFLPGTCWHCQTPASSLQPSELTTGFKNLFTPSLNPLFLCGGKVSPKPRMPLLCDKSHSL